MHGISVPTIDTATYHKKGYTDLLYKENLVRAAGLEPARAYALQILSLVCLPFHHARNRRPRHLF